MQVVKQTVEGLNKEKIKEATEASPTATVTMISLGFRERARTHTNLLSVKNELLRMNEKIVDKDYMSFWKALEAAGAGSLILGRRGGQTRFEWNYSLKQIAQLAIEGKETEIKRLQLKMDNPELVKEQSEPAKILLTAPKAPMVVKTIDLHFGRTAQVIMPSNTTSEEIVHFIRELVCI